MSSLGQTVPVNGDHHRNGESEPFMVRALGLDLDGTMMASYMTLKAILMLKASMGSEHADEYLRRLQESSFQELLHVPPKALTVFQQFTEEKRLTIPRSVLGAVQQAQQLAFEPYEGLIQVLKLAKEAGVPVFVYTNSPDYYAVTRLIKAGIDPTELGITAMWTRADEKIPPLSWYNGNTGIPEHRSTEIERNWAKVIVPYNFKKPDDTPFRDMARVCGVDPHEVLYVGEGTNDLRSVFMDQKNPAARFALQEQGAKDICSEQQAINEQLRRGTERLGYEAVQQHLQETGLESKVLRLQRGFVDLLEMIEHGKITLVPPPHAPCVAEKQLYRSPEAPRPRNGTTYGLNGFRATQFIPRFVPGT